jgi:hypothetical protein
VPIAPAPKLPALILAAGLLAAADARANDYDALVATSDAGLLAGGSSAVYGGTPVLRAQVGGTWTDVPLPPEVQGLEGRSTAVGGEAGGTLFVGLSTVARKKTTSALWRRADGAWTRLPDFDPTWLSVRRLEVRGADDVWALVLIRGGAQLVHWTGGAYDVVPPPTGTILDVDALVVEPDGAVVVAARDAQGAGVYRLAGGAWTRLGPAQPGVELDGLVRLVDGTLVRSTGTAPLERWDGATWRALPGWDGHGLRATSLAAGPDGSLWAAASIGTDGTVLGWRDGTMRYRDGELQDPPRTWAVDRLATRGDGAVCWRTTSNDLPCVDAGVFRPLPGAAPEVAEAVPAPYPERDARAADVLSAIRGTVAEENEGTDRLQILLDAWRAAGGVDQVPTSTAHAIHDLVRDTLRPMIQRHAERLGELGLGPRTNRLLDAWVGWQAARLALLSACEELADLRLQGGDDARIRAVAQGVEDASAEVDEANRQLDAMLPEYARRNGL